MSLPANESSDKLSYTQYNAYKASEWIWRLFPPILITAGSIGNILAILTLTRKRLRRSDISLYLIILAMADIVSLYASLLPRWVLEIFRLQFNTANCKFVKFMTYLSTDVSVWALVMVTMYRAVSVLAPHKTRSCNLCALMTPPIVIIVVLFAINAHVLYGMDINEGQTVEVRNCQPNEPGYLYFYLTIWSWIDFCVFCFVPFTTLIASNVCIILKVRKSRKTVTSGSTANAQANQKRTASMTKIIILLNSVFFLTTSPITIYNIGSSGWKIEQPQDKARHKLAMAVLLNVMYSNNAANFYIYCLSGTLFRKELVAIFCRKKNSVDTRDAPTETLHI